MVKSKTRQVTEEHASESAGGRLKKPNWRERLGIPGNATQATEQKVEPQEGYSFSTYMELSMYMELTEAVYAASPTTTLDTTEVSKVLKHANAVFGRPEKAESWLRKPKIQLDGKAPVDILGTPEGRAEVENLLGMIEYGMVG